MSRKGACLAAAAVFVLTLAVAAPATRTASAQDMPQIYGGQLMTEQERLEYRQRMRSATSDEERARIRAEHHERMQERAKEMGVMLPEVPPARGRGMGMGPGTGAGRGQGPGMGGQGSGRGGQGRSN